MNAIVYTFLIVIIMGGLTVILIALRDKKRKKADAVRIKTDKKANRLNSLGNIYLHTPLLKTEYAKIREKVMLIEPGDTVDVYDRSTSIMTKGLLAGIAVCAAALIMACGDVYFSLAGIFTAYVIFTQSIRSSLEKMDLKLMREFSEFLTDIRHYYHDKRIVDDALFMAMEDAPYEISRHLQKLYAMVSSTDTKKASEEYVQEAPNRFFTTFASICASIKEYGDKQLENKSSLFLSNLGYLEEEVRMEILHRVDISQRFMLKVPLTIFPIIFIKPIEGWAKSLMDGMENIYKGIYGLIAMLVIFLVTFVCYTIVCILRDDKKESLVEDSIWMRLSMKQPISSLLNREINRHYTKALKTDEALKQTGDRTGPKAFLLKRIVCGLACGLCVLAITISMPFYERSGLRNNFAGAFEQATVVDDETMQVMQEVARIKLKEFEGTTISAPDLAEDIMQTTDVHQESYATMIAELVLERIGQISGVYYRFFYLFAVAAGFLVGFFIPEWFLKYRLKSNEMNKEDEVNQFNTLMLIFMHADGITMSGILEWMERFSFSFRTSIVECAMMLDFGEQKALRQMRDKERAFGPFKRFVDNLLAVENVGIAAAFDELTSDREYYKQKRMQESQWMTKKRAAQAQYISMLPLLTTIGLYIIAPLLIAAFQMLATLSSAIS